MDRAAGMAKSIREITEAALYGNFIGSLERCL
jgi:hypothetical protein